LPPEENKQATPSPRPSNPEQFEKGSRGADVFPAADPAAIQAIMSAPNPMLLGREVATPQASAAPPAAGPESAD